MKLDEVGSPHKHSFSSIQNSVSTNNSSSLNDEYLVVKNNLDETPGSPFMRRTTTDPAQKNQAKIRPHSLFERSTTDFTKGDILHEADENGSSGDTGNKSKVIFLGVHKSNSTPAETNKRRQCGENYFVFYFLI